MESRWFGGEYLSRFMRVGVLVDGGENIDVSELLL